MLDGHAHLNEIQNIDAALERAKAAGVRGIVAVGMDLRSNRETLALAARFPGFVHPAVGYHPWSIVMEEIEENLDFLQEKSGECVALGEVGIDYATKVKKTVQQEIFARVLAIAAEKKRPVIVHSRYSHERTHQMVRDSGVEKAVFHWYSGPPGVLLRLLADGYFISCTPALAFSPAHRAAAQLAPIRRILVETDSPVTYSGKAAEPADLIVTLRALATVKEVPFDEAARITAENLRNFYGIDVDAGSGPGDSPPPPSPP